MKRYPNIHARTSIYAYVRAHAPLDEVGLTAGGETLPDENKLRAESKFGWAAGAMDGVGSHHFGAGQDSKDVEVLADAVQAAVEKPTRRHLAALYKMVEPRPALSIVDPIVASLTQRRVNAEGLHDLGVWLATTSPDREPVKLGIAFLGVSKLGDAIGVVRLLGRHEEFTLYAAVAFRNGLEDAEPELFALAQHVDGWGRIQLVERLAGTSDPVVRDWILREGFRNSIMYEYLAYLAATVSDLAGALATSNPDRELLTAAGEILRALFRGGPAQDIDDYADGVLATERLVRHLETRAERLEDGIALRDIEYFVADGDQEWDERAQRGWTPEVRLHLAHRCAAILGRDLWRDLVILGLHSDDEGEFWRADELAIRVGVDAYPVHRANLETNPRDQIAWFRVWALADDARAAELLEFALARLPLEEIATGPADELGLGEKWSLHGSVDVILRNIEHRPGAASALVVAALDSPVIRNRNAALRVLEKWPPTAWPSGVESILERTATTDPNRVTRDAARALLDR